MAGLTNIYVNNLMENISPSPENFKGVLPCDFFLQKMKMKKESMKKGDCFIINLSASSHSGSHFVALFLTSKNSAEYFDSYGLPSSIDQNLVEAFKMAKLEIQEFKRTIQSNNSKFCGIFCVSYLLARQIDISMEKFASLFDHEHLDRNNQIAVEFIKIFVQRFGSERNSL